MQYYGRLKVLFDFNKLEKFMLTDYFQNEIIKLANITKCVITLLNVIYFMMKRKDWCREYLNIILKIK